MLVGKGIWIENPATTDNQGDPVTLVNLARAAGLRHTVIKVGDGTEPFGDESLGELVEAFQAARFAVWGAHRIYGDDPAAEAEVSIGRVDALSLDGLAVVAEAEYVGKHAAATAYMDALRAALPTASLGLSSFRFPDYYDPPGVPDEQTFPFDAFLARCTVALPKIFWVAEDGGDPAAELLESVSQYRRRWPHLAYVPVGAAYGVRFGDFWWTATPEAIRQLLERAQALNLPAVGFWSWSTARHDAGNSTYPGTELWDAIARFDFGEARGPEVPFIEEVTVWPGGEGYSDGVHEGDPALAWQTFTFDDGHSVCYKSTSRGHSTVWARWNPHLTQPGSYEVLAFVPSQRATTTLAKYHIHGARWGRFGEVYALVDQSKYCDQWVSLGVFEFDPQADPMSGVVDLTDMTPEDPPRYIAFDAIRWRRVLKDVVVIGEDRPQADGVDSPVGSDDERVGTAMWPGGWSDVYDFASLGADGYQTGAGLVQLSKRDKSRKVFAPMSGVVTWVEPMGQWERVVILDADPLDDGLKVWLRLWLLDQVEVEEGARVARGDLLGYTGPVQGRFLAHLGYDVARVNLSQRPWDWPGADLARVRRDYLDPLAFTRDHRPAVHLRPEPDFPLLGLHEGEDWLLNNVPGPRKGYSVVLWSYADNPNPNLDFSRYADAGVRILLRVGYGYANGTGTMPRPEGLAAFEDGVVRALTNARGVYAAHYCNEINNFTEWPSGYALTPEYYIESYNRVWRRIPREVRLAPAPIDPYHSYQGSNPRLWWRKVLNGIEGADGLALHCKTQGNSPGQIDSDERFGDPPLRGWQFLHFRVLESSLEDVPSGMSRLPVWITEANPQRLNSGGLGWEPNNGEWVRRCFEYVRRWNADPSHQPVHAVVLYRYPAFDEWRMDDKPQIVEAVRREIGHT
jgi:hypothetical protein